MGKVRSYFEKKEGTKYQFAQPSYLGDIGITTVPGLFMQR